MIKAFRNGWTGGQYTLCRWLTGLFFTGWFLAFAAGPHGLGGNLGGPFSWVHLPALSPTLTRIGALVFAVAAIGLFVGLRKPIFAIVLGMGSLIYLDSGSNLWPLAATTAWLHAVVPFSPWGSVGDAKGAIGHDWRLPGWVYAAAWGGLGLFVVSCALRLVQLGDPGDIPAPALVGLVACALWPLCLIRRTRIVLWLVYLAIWILFFVKGVPWIVLGPLALLLTMAFDPAWIPPRKATGEELLFYDGACGLCHGAVLFLLAEDRNDPPLRFAPLDSELFRSKVAPTERAALPDSLVYLTGEGSLKVRSEGILAPAARLGGLWRLGGAMLRVIPASLRDAVYARIASVRHRWFQRPSDVCPIVPQELKDRFPVTKAAGSEDAEPTPATWHEEC